MNCPKCNKPMTKVEFKRKKISYLLECGCFKTDEELLQAFKEKIILVEAKNIQIRKVVENETK